MNKKIRLVITAFLASLLLIAAGAYLAFAESGSGTGNGTGEKSDIALTVTSSSIKNGGTNVPLNPTIDIKFNKNVVNMTVKDSNSKCFHLVDSGDNSVAIKIIFPDDQLKREYREHIFISPVQNLAPNSKYTLYIDKTLQAKNAKYIDNAHMIAFTTGKAATAAANASLKDLADDIEVYTNKLPIAAESYLKEGTASSALDKTASQAINNKNISVIIIAVLASAVIFFTILLFAGRKKK